MELKKLNWFLKFIGIGKNFIERNNIIQANSLFAGFNSHNINSSGFDSFVTEAIIISISMLTQKLAFKRNIQVS